MNLSQIAQNYRVALLIWIAGLLIFPINPALSVDAQLQGQNLYPLLIRDSQTVEYRNIDGDVIDSISVPSHLYSDESHLLAVPFQGEFGVIAIKTSGRRRVATATLITAQGIVGSMELGPTRNTSIFAYDLTQNGSLDLVLIGRRGQTTLIYSPFTPESTTLQFRAPKRPRDQVTLTSFQGAPAIVVLRTRGGILRNPRARRPIIRAQVRPISNPAEVHNFRMPRRSRGELVPLLSGTSMLEGEFLLINHRPKRTLYGYVNIYNRSIVRKKSEAKAVLSAGTFVEEGGIYQVLHTQNGILSVLDPDAGFTLLFQKTLLDGSTPQTPQNDDPDSPYAPPSDCSDTVPYALIQQIINNYQAGNWIQAINMLNLIAWNEMCQETAEETNQLLLAGLGFSFAYSSQEVPGQLFSSSESFAILGSPVLSASANARAIPGCDILRSSSDGPGGFVYKTGEKDGKVAALLPSSIYTTDAWLTRHNGRNIEKLKYDGRTNGWRPTFRSRRSQTSYPKKLIVKARVQTGFNSEQFYCWVLNNSHVRND